MGINLQLPGLTELRPRITVIGVGGAGGDSLAGGSDGGATVDAAGGGVTGAATGAACLSTTGCSNRGADFSGEAGGDSGAATGDSSCVAGSVCVSLVVGADGTGADSLLFCGGCF